MGGCAVGLATHTRSGRGWTPRFERVVRGECAGDRIHNSPRGARVIQRIAAAVSKVLFLSWPYEIQQLSDDHAVSNPGKFPEMVVGSVSGNFVVCDPNVAGIGRRAMGDGGRAVGGENATISGGYLLQITGMARMARYDFGRNEGISKFAFSRMSGQAAGGATSL